MAQTTESRAWRVLVINPGSTSTKVGLFDGEKPVFTVNVAHEASELAKFAGVSDQLPYRLGLIEAALAENGVDLASVDAFVGRGGGLLPLPGGTYEVDDVLLDHPSAAPTACSTRPSWGRRSRTPLRRGAVARPLW